jgi:hypothetical protein
MEKVGSNPQTDPADVRPRSHNRNQAPDFGRFYTEPKTETTLKAEELQQGNQIIPLP